MRRRVELFLVVIAAIAVTPAARALIVQCGPAVSQHEYHVIGGQLDFKWPHPFRVLRGSVRSLTGTLLARLKLEGESTEADVVLGLDNYLMAEAAATGLFDNEPQTGWTINGRPFVMMVNSGRGSTFTAATRSPQ